RIGPGKTPERPRWRFKRRRLASRRLHRHVRRAQRSQRCKSKASRSLNPQAHVWDELPENFFHRETRQSDEHCGALAIHSKEGAQLAQ
ncbi:MAG: hypothetical protein ACK5XM_05885, partial [Betaproteobacteria bacterium]